MATVYIYKSSIQPILLLQNLKQPLTLTSETTWRLNINHNNFTWDNAEQQ